MLGIADPVKAQSIGQRVVVVVVVLVVVVVVVGGGSTLIITDPVNTQSKLLVGNTDPVCAQSNVVVVVVVLVVVVVVGEQTEHSLDTDATGFPLVTDTDTYWLPSETYQVPVPAAANIAPVNVLQLQKLPSSPVTVADAKNPQASSDAPPNPTKNVAGDGSGTTAGGMKAIA